MAYQNVGTPRFYIDTYQYLKSTGFDFQAYIDETADLNESSEYIWTPLDYPEIFTLNPQIATKLNFENSGTKVFYLPLILNSRNIDLTGNLKRYCAILNHNLDEAKLGEGAFIKQGFNSHLGISYANDTMNTEILNYEKPIENSGCTILHFDVNPTIEDRFNMIALFDLYNTNSDGTEFINTIGAISVGFMYDMPVSPDLDLSMTIEFDGYDTTTTLGGSTLTNVRYTGAPWWRDSENNKIEPWSVGESNGVSKRNGRRVWSMKFSYLSDKDIFSSNYMSNTYLESGSGSGYDTDDDLVLDSNDNPIAFENTLENDDSFVAQVLNKVGNGQRFIFQPDNTNNNPDQFAICQLDQDSLQIKQVAFNTYSISLNIREVW